MTKAQKERFRKMSKRERAEYLAGGRVTTKKITQVKENEDGKLAEFLYGWKPRLRSLYIGKENYDTEGEAIEAGRDFRERCKRIANGEEEVPA